MSDCERYEALISELLDGELSAEEETEVREHMAHCAACAAMYEAFSAAGEALRADASDVPATLHSGIMAKVTMAEKAQKTQNKIIRLRPIFEEMMPTGINESTAPPVAIIMQLAAPATLLSHMAV